MIRLVDEHYMQVTTKYYFDAYKMFLKNIKNVLSDSSLPTLFVTMGHIWLNAMTHKLCHPYLLIFVLFAAWLRGLSSWSTSMFLFP